MDSQQGALHENRQSLGEEAVRGLRPSAAA